MPKTNQLHSIPEKQWRKMVLQNQAALEGGLQGLHQGLLRAEQKNNRLWNTMNVLIRVMQKQFNLTQEQFNEIFKKVGEEVFAEAKQIQEEGIRRAKAGESTEGLEDDTGKAMKILDGIVAAAQEKGHSDAETKEA